MLDKTRKKILEYLDSKTQEGIDGTFHEIDNVTRISAKELDNLMDIYRSVRPDCSAETGMAYGFSTLSILDYIEESGHGHHIAIDPAQIQEWHGIALKSIEQLGFARNFSWIESRSDQAFTQMIKEGKALQFVFLDGSHHFDGIIADFFLASQILDIGGVVVFNYLWMPGGRAIKSFISSNAINFEILPIESEQLFAFKKIGVERRSWDHFVPFDGSGARKAPAGRGVLRTILNRAGGGS